ncbi:amidohydrolase family protein [Streptomyces sp. NPDC097610]|uniref:amidohydrolase family protein n=1 Tax=Streptomyces sp. NPDC097610 TaxID=3157227 RepID=UPI003321C363
MVVDHLGLPTASSLSYPGSAVLSRLPTAQHVWVKAAAPYRSVPQAATATLRSLLGTGGGERMLWGSDWPWTRYEEGRLYSTTLAWLTASSAPPKPSEPCAPTRRDCLTGRLPTSGPTRTHGRLSVQSRLPLSRVQGP